MAADDAKPPQDRELRNLQILELHCRNVPHPTIAQVMGCSRETVRAVVKAGLEAMRAQFIDQYDPYQMVAESASTLTSLRAEALQIASSEPDPSVKLHAMRTAADMNQRLVSMMQDVGMLPKELGTLRWRDGDGPRNARDELPEAARVPDVIAAYESAFGDPYPPAERQRIVDLDSPDARVPRAAPAVVPEPHGPVLGDQRRVLPSDPAGHVAGESVGRQDPGLFDPPPRQ